MFKRFCSSILICFLLTGCVHHKLNKVPQAPLTASIKTSLHKEVTEFNQIDVQGRININLHTGYKKPQVILRGDARDLAQVKTVVAQNTLYLVLGKGFPRYGVVYAEIQGQSFNRLHYVGSGIINGNQLHTNSLDVSLENTGTTKLSGMIRLRQLDVKGSGVVQISGLASPYLKVYIKGNPKVQLTGVAKAARLEVDGNGCLSLYWIKSDNLLIRAKKGAKIQLAGAVNRLDLELWGNSYFKGRYLRAMRSFVKTHGHSVAEISSVKHQSNLASEASDIYYYNLPTTRADFMAFNGSVLDMREWSQPDLKDFTLYNKQFP